MRASVSSTDHRTSIDTLFSLVSLADFLPLLTMEKFGTQES